MVNNLKKIKLIVIDIDGTLVDTNGMIGEKTLKLSKELKKYGVICTLSSARSFYYSSHIADQLEVDVPIVTLNGALIKNRLGNVIYSAVIKSKTIQKIVQLAELNYGKVTMCDENNLFITPRHSVIMQYSRLNAPVKEVTSYENLSGVLEVLVYCEDKASLHAIKDNIGFPYNFGITMNVTKSPTNEYYLLTIKKRGSDKLKSVKRLVKHLNLSKKNIAVIGDWHNDMPLFDYGAFNVAVQNAIPELKRKADYITNSTNNEDAVGEVLELFHQYKTKGIIKNEI